MPLEIDIPRQALQAENPKDTELQFQTADGFELGAVSSSVLPEPVKLLPALNTSDQAFRDRIIGMSNGLEPWLGEIELLRKYLTLVNDFSQGLCLQKHMTFLRLKLPFVVEPAEDGWKMAEAGYRRYDTLAVAIAAIDADKDGQCTVISSH